MTKEQLKQARLRLRMTQSELAEALGMHGKNSIAMMEGGLRPVMKTTELSVSYLLLVSKKRKGKR
jgi:transcriptional regulator with XRE-family HTH domain